MCASCNNVVGNYDCRTFALSRLHGSFKTTVTSWVLESLERNDIDFV